MGGRRGVGREGEGGTTQTAYHHETTKVYLQARQEFLAQKLALQNISGHLESQAHRQAGQFTL